MNRQHFAVYGGSFDPIHLGHIWIAQHIHHIFHFNQFIFLPCGTPALKKNCQASPADRLKMLQLALQPYPQFTIDTQELYQTHKTYSIHSLIKLRQQWGPDCSLSFILGEDAFASFMQWYRWKDILNYCHIIYHSRPMQHIQYSAHLNHYIQCHHATDPQQLLQSSHGYIYKVTTNPLPYSSTEIRQAVAKQQHPQGLSNTVLGYIQVQQLYQQPD